MSGPPSSYTPKKGERVCKLVAEGFSQREICAREGLSRSTLSNWLRNHPDFEQKFSRAFNASLEIRFYELLDHCTDTEGDWIEKETGAGRVEKVFDHNHVARDRLIADNLKWALSKRLPHKYGELVNHRHTGAAGDDPIAITVSNEERRRKALEAIDVAFAERTPEPLPPPPPTPVPEKYETVVREFAAEGDLEVAPDVARLPVRYHPPRVTGDWSG